MSTTAPHLLIEGTGETIALRRDLPEMRIGRDPRGFHRFFSQSFGAHQFSIVPRERDFAIEPGRGSQPTLLNGARCERSSSLRHDDRIQVGETALRFVDPTLACAVPGTSPEPAPGPLTPDAGPSQDTPAGAVAAAPDPELTLLHATAEPARSLPEFPLDGELILGRDRSAAAVLPSPRVSRRHARLSRTAAGTSLEDLGSSNGTFVNGQRIRGTVTLRAGDRIVIGPFCLRFTGQSLIQTTDATSRIVARDLVQTVPDPDRPGVPRRILGPASLVIEPGELLLIMGESGGGKSTLMNALSGRVPARAGSVLFNDLDLYEDFAALKHHIALVPQHNLLFDELTLEENLRFTARLRLPADTDAAGIDAAVRAAIQSVGLTGRESTRCARLSGGQKRRACLANETLARPGILFLDEVSSGLDEGADREMLQLFRQMANSGMTVVCIAHSLKNVARYCDMVAVVARPGVLLFHGTPTEALAHFGVKELSEVFDLLNSRPDGDAWRLELLRGFEASACFARHVRGRLERCAPAPAPPAPAPQARWTERRLPELRRQLRILLDRCRTLLLADHKTLAIALGQAVLVGLVLGLVFGEIPDDSSHQPQQETMCFLLGITCFWLGCSNASKELVKERDLYQQERNINLDVASYVLGKAAVLGVLALVQVAFLTVLVVFLSTVPGPLALQVAHLAVTALVGTALGLAISALARTRDQANTIVPIVLIPQIVLAGRIVDLPDWAEWLASVAVTGYWSYRGMDDALFDDLARSFCALGVQGLQLLVFLGSALLLLLRRDMDVRALWRKARGFAGSLRGAGRFAQGRERN